MTVELLRDRFPEASLFVMSPAASRFETLERAAAISGLPVVRADRRLDPQILRSRELGYRNGHVPVTGVLSAIAVLAATLNGFDAVAMSNEWSSSVGNLHYNGNMVNHQYSKSYIFEKDFRAVLHGSLGYDPDYFSMLRPWSGLWIASRFAKLSAYHPVFRSCNHGFRVAAADRLQDWCGVCDKCCFVDLILAPFMDRRDLREIFGGREPLENEALLDRFRLLVGASGLSKPFECVGDPVECQTAVMIASRRDDRAGNSILRQLADEVRDSPIACAEYAPFSPRGSHFVPEHYAPTDQLV